MNGEKWPLEKSLFAVLPKSFASNGSDGAQRRKK